MKGVGRQALVCLTDGCFSHYSDIRRQVAVAADGLLDLRLGQTCTSIGSALLALNNIGYTPTTRLAESSMQDLIGLSGAAKEIISAISRGIGTLYRPRAIRNEADAEAYALKVRAKAEAEANVVTIDTYARELEWRAVGRFKETLIKKQLNLDSIVDDAIEEANRLQGDSAQVESAQTLEPEWVERFIGYAEGISTKQLQQIWSKILARQAISGEAVSLNTLDVARNITRDDADIFERFLTIKNALGEEFYPLEHADLLECGFHPIEFEQLSNLRLIEEPKVPWQMVDNFVQQAYPTAQVILQSMSPFVCRIGERVVAVYDKKNLITVYAHRLTREGEQIASIISRKEPEKAFTDKCFNAAINHFTGRMNYTVEIDADVSSEHLVMLDTGEREFLESQQQEYEVWKRNLKNARE